MSPRLFVSFLAATLILAGPACTPHVAQSVFTPVPSGLDSAATTRWLTEQQRFCKRTFLRLIDEGAIGDSLRGDSLMVYRYTQRLTGVQCLNRRTTRLSFRAEARQVPVLSFRAEARRAGGEESQSSRPRGLASGYDNGRR